jgi:hypothetical protein
LAYEWVAPVAGFAGALVGAGAAVGGVLITQRSERRKAQADRVWKERSEIYMAIYKWANGDQFLYIDPLDFSEKMRFEERGEDIQWPTEEETARLNIFGSKAVTDAYMRAQRQLIAHPPRSTEGDAIWVTDEPRDYGLRKLKESILAETQGDQ